MTKLDVEEKELPFGTRFNHHYDDSEGRGATLGSYGILPPNSALVALIRIIIYIGMFQTCPKHRQDPFFFNTLAFAAGILQDGHGVSFPLLKVGPEKVGGLARVTVSNRDGV